uniref:inactive protein RESTRICTED TEV MOVEMENT 1-like n=1 Tax=Erigeron canadensis TaxID=72917 RepID=UPI001CB95DA5|nr:inactive protein RESTRICTED TEV MOVEMENT 1-like [Erigeron canadensis]
MMKLNPKRMKGDAWDEGGKSGIVQILISHEEGKINSFQFAYVDQKGDVRHSEIHGQLNGWKFNIVTFDYPSEFLTSMSGLYDYQGLVTIAFGSNKRMYGPFGMTKKTGDPPEFAALAPSTYDKFNYEFGPGAFFAGFHGSVLSSSVNAIGIYINPITSLAQVKPVDSHINEQEPNEEQVESNPIDSLSELNIK